MNDEAARRFRRSQAYLRMWALPADETESMSALVATDARVREPQEIGRRLLATTLLALKGQGLTQAEAFAFADAYDVWPALTVEENELLLDPAPSRLDLVNAAWRFEVVWVLLWSLGLVRHLAFPDRVADSGAAVETCMKVIADQPRSAWPERRPVSEVLDAADISRRLSVVAESARAIGTAPPGAMDYGVVHERARAFVWLVPLVRPGDETLN